MTSSLKWDHRFVEVARLVAGWSKDPSTQVGAVAVRERRILATGYNGLARGVKDCWDRLEDRETRLLLTAHAETNLLTHAAEAGVSLRNSTVYVTWPTCAQCASHLINAGVVRVVWPQTDIPARWMDSFYWAAQVYREAGVDWEALPEEGVL